MHILLQKFQSQFLEEPYSCPPPRVYRPKYIPLQNEQNRLKWRLGITGPHCGESLVCSNSWSLFVVKISGRAGGPIS